MCVCVCAGILCIYGDGGVAGGSSVKCQGSGVIKYRGNKIQKMSGVIKYKKCVPQSNLPFPVSKGWNVYSTYLKHTELLI